MIATHCALNHRVTARTLSPFFLHAKVFDVVLSIVRAGTLVLSSFAHDASQAAALLGLAICHVVVDAGGFDKCRAGRDVTVDPASCRHLELFASPAS